MILYYSQICVDDRATAIIKGALEKDHTHLRELSQFWMESMLLFRAAISLVLISVNYASERPKKSNTKLSWREVNGSTLLPHWLSYGLLLCTYAWLPKGCLGNRTE
ncbi:hypothetical protein BDW72DRAFT_158287 [Aspergillus terricola var. indicus]